MNHLVTSWPLDDLPEEHAESMAEPWGFCEHGAMGVVRHLVQMFRAAPSKRQLVRSLALDGKGGNRTLTSADGTSLSVRQSGDGVALVLVHGALDGIGAFSLVELRLAETYSVSVYDRRGRGGSGDTEPYSLDGEVDDLRAVIEATGEAPHVVAHSYGAVIALQAQLAGIPMRSLVVYEPPINGDAIPVEKIAEIRRAVAEDRPDDAIRDMATSLAGLTDEEVGIAMSIPPVRKRLRNGVKVVAREIDALRECDWASLPVTDAPTLILRGGRSTAEVYPTDAQLTEIADAAEVATLDGQGHVAQVMAPIAFGDAVLAFVDKH